MTAHQGAILTTLERWYRPAEILKMATAVNGELLAMSGPRNPYPGKLGVIEAGALADLILVDGDPPPISSSSPIRTGISWSS